MRDHGGNLDAAMARHGGAPEAWIDLSTGINPRPYPPPDIPARAWAALPTRAESAALRDTAAAAYDTRAAILPLAGAQAAIQMVPMLRKRGVARVLGPTYNEHAATLEAQGWWVERIDGPDRGLADLAGADLAVVVNPNNPDGRRHAPETLLALARQVGLLVVDESFADPAPELSLAPHLEEAGEGVVVLRSFGKFYGLAGLRLGFALGGAREVTALEATAGPWPVSGPALEIGRAALADRAWQAETVARLRQDAARLDALAAWAGWRLVGGTELFRLYETGGAVAVQARLAEARIWSRAFPWSEGLLRLGLPDGAEQWSRLEAALR